MDRRHRFFAFSLAQPRCECDHCNFTESLKRICRIAQVETRSRVGRREYAVPPFATSDFVVDLPTLCAVTVFITVTGGVLLLFGWWQNRSEPALALWGIAYLIGSAGAALLAVGGRTPQAWTICGPNALICCAYGVMWAGARSFEGRRIRLISIFAGALIWLGACETGITASVKAGVVIESTILFAYVLLAAREVWYARDRELISRWPTLAVLFTHAGFLLARIPLAGALLSAVERGDLRPTGFVIMAFEALFATYCLAFLRVSMAKERAELEQRKAALTDSLTGIANRRAFFDTGAALLERIVGDRRRAALLLFDLDRFKEVNDTSGHQAGDCVLKAFSQLMATAARRNDLVARLGGEEFACLLGDVSMAQALQLADRVRRDFAAMRFADLPNAATVSVGVAMAGEAGCNLSSLLATADRALYRAKADGRNRVAPAPLVVIESMGEPFRQAAEIGRPATVAAPMSG
jgi:diguanylate cyclase (GGDEF)-like protein